VHIDDDSFEEAVASIEKQFENREFENSRRNVPRLSDCGLLFAEMGAILFPKRGSTTVQAYVDAINGLYDISKYIRVSRRITVPLYEWGWYPALVRSILLSSEEILSYYNNIIDEVAKHSLTEYGPNC